MKNLDSVAMGDAIRKVVSDFGVGILTNKARFEAVVRDYLHTDLHKNEQQTLIFVINMGAGQELLKALKTPMEERDRIFAFMNTLLADECGLAEERCNDILAAFAAAFRWDDDSPLMGSAPKGQAQMKDGYDAGQKSDLYVEGEWISFGRYQWQVLHVEEKEVLLLSSELTDIGIPYNIDGGETSWEVCSLRRWLNSEFVGRFSGEEQNRILRKAVRAEHNPWYGTYAGNTIKDKVFLLSISEAVRYMGDSGALRSRPVNDWLDADGSSFAIDDPFNERRRSAYKGENTWWWLRSPGSQESKAAYVNANGVILLKGESALDDGGKCCVGVRPGVRPAIWIRKS